MDTLADSGGPELYRGSQSTRKLHIIPPLCKFVHEGPRLEGVALPEVQGVILSEGPDFFFFFFNLRPPRTEMISLPP